MSEFFLILKILIEGNLNLSFMLQMKPWYYKKRKTLFLNFLHQNKVPFFLLFLCFMIFSFYGILYLRSSSLNKKELLNESFLKEFCPRFCTVIESAVDIYRSSSLIHEISMPRPIESIQHNKVVGIISDKLKKAGLKVFHDTFETKTVIGKKNFTNIIAINNLNASSFTILAAHYDSKKFNLSPEEDLFSGASDSAASCCILLALAMAIYEFKTISINTGLIFIFFDGEEAFKTWSNEDSLYGSRHLVQLFSNEREKIKPSELGLTEYLSTSTYETSTAAFYIPSISLFILLDLLGSIDSKSIYSLFENTKSEFYELVRISEIVFPFLPFKSTRAKDKIMKMESLALYIEDDHIPFQKKGIPILLLIPYPFPKHWHTIDDSIVNLDNFSLYHWAISLYLFIIIRDHK